MMDLCKKKVILIMLETLQIFIEAPIELRTIILASLIMGIYSHFKKEGKK